MHISQSTAMWNIECKFHTRWYKLWYKLMSQFVHICDPSQILDTQKCWNKVKVTKFDDWQNSVKIQTQTDDLILEIQAEPEAIISGIGTPRWPWLDPINALRSQMLRCHEGSLSQKRELPIIPLECQVVTANLFQGYLVSITVTQAKFPMVIN